MFDTALAVGAVWVAMGLAFWVCRLVENGYRGLTEWRYFVGGALAFCITLPLGPACWYLDWREETRP